MQKKVSVEYAINVAMYAVMWPFVFGGLLLVVIGILLVGVHGYSAWLFIPVLIVSILLPAAYYSIGLTKWRIWAFANVSNIFELQQSRDSNPLLVIAENTIWLSTPKDKEKRKEIENRLNGPIEFTDDPDVFDYTEVYYSKPKLYAYVVLYLSSFVGGIAVNMNVNDPEIVPVLVLLDIVFCGIIGYYTIKTIKKLQKSTPNIVLSNDGITSEAAGFSPWKDISGENSNYIWKGGDSNPYHELQYTCPAGDIVVLQKLFDTNPLRIQHLLYVYRGRHDKKTNTTTTKQLNLPTAVAAMSKWSPFKSK